MQCMLHHIQPSPIHPWCRSQLAQLVARLPSRPRLRLPPPRPGVAAAAGGAGAVARRARRAPAGAPRLWFGRCLPCRWLKGGQGRGWAQLLPFSTHAAACLPNAAAYVLAVHLLFIVQVGCGADELIDLLMRCVLDEGDKIVDCPPTFTMCVAALPCS